jgi:hypothetical protein
MSPRLRGFDGKEQALPSWEGAMTEDWLGKWAMNQMLINVSTRSDKTPGGGRFRQASAVRRRHVTFGQVHRCRRRA